MIAFIAEPGHAIAATMSVRAVALYGIVVLGAILSLAWRAELGLYLLCVLLPLQTTRYHLHAFPLGANMVDILLICSIIGSRLRRPEKLVRRTAVFIFLGFMAVFYYLSLVRGAFFLGVSMPIWISDERFVDYKNFMVMPLLALAVTMIVRSRRQIATILILACTTSLAVDYSYLKSSAGRDFSHYSEETRDAGPLGYAGENGLACYLVEITACVLPLLALRRAKALKIPLLLLLAANVCCILFSYSREAYLALAAVLCFIAILRIRWLLVLIFVAALAWQTVLPPAVQERMAMSYSKTDDLSGARLDPSAQERVMLWTDALVLVRENPVFGTGFMTYANMKRVGSYRDTHNFYLKMLVETGVVGLLLFLAQLGLFFREGWRLFRSATEPLLSLLGLGFASLMLAAAIVNIFGDRWLFIQVDSNLWILLGCVICASSLSNKESSAAAPARPAARPKNKASVFHVPAYSATEPAARERSSVLALHLHGDSRL